MASVEFISQETTPFATAASPPEAMASCFRMLACGAVKPVILRLKKTSFGAMSAMPAGSTPTRLISMPAASADAMSIDLTRNLTWLSANRRFVRHTSLSAIFAPHRIGEHTARSQKWPLPRLTDNLPVSPKIKPVPGTETLQAVPGAVSALSSRAVFTPGGTVPPKTTSSISSPETVSFSRRRFARAWSVSIFSLTICFALA